MGTHPSGPANVNDTKESLLEWLGNHPYAVGRVPKGYKGDDLPFMFKVLSVKTALSIQVRNKTKLNKVSKTINKRFLRLC